jgi:hypothetical protein
MRAPTLLALPDPPEAYVGNLPRQWPRAEVKQLKGYKVKNVQRGASENVLTI